MKHRSTYDKGSEPSREIKSCSCLFVGFCVLCHFLSCSYRTLDFFSKCKHGHCFAGYLVTVVETFGLFWELMLHIDHTLNLSGFHHGTLGQIPVPIKRLKRLLYFFKASYFRAHACCQAQGEVWDEVLGSRRLEDLLLCVLSLFRYLNFYCVVQK